MKDDKGWICLHRDIRYHWIWQDKPFSKGQSFADLLLLANHSDSKLLIGNELVLVKRGDLITSTVKLSEYWGWSRTKVKAFLKALENDDMIIVKSDNKKTTIHIVNYERYQGFVSLLEQQKDSKETVENQQENIKNATENQLKGSTKTSAKHQKITNNNDNNETNIPPLPPEGSVTPDNGFEEFWQAYPRKENKPAALKAWNKIKPDAELRQVILNALEQRKQSDQWRKDKGRFIPHPATWLNGRRWEDSLEQSAQPPPKYEDFDPNDPYKYWGCG